MWQWLQEGRGPKKKEKKKLTNKVNAKSQAKKAGNELAGWLDKDYEEKGKPVKKCVK